ncbi:MAG: hypothetical protein LBR29_10585 [Methylobacteriaceae bacterium]|nr:hypothetical protein [Methylobacteriaceae bacterium]
MMWCRCLFHCLWVSLVLLAAPARAQAPGCEDVKPILEQRQKIIAQINSWNKNKDKRVDPTAACQVGRNLVANGEKLVKWIELNKDWCGVPDQFAENILKDHKNSIGLRANACKAAAQMEKMKQQGAAEGHTNPLGAGGLSGQWKIPQGAL